MPSKVLVNFIYVCTQISSLQIQVSFGEQFGVHMNVCKDNL